MDRHTPGVWAVPQAGRLPPEHVAAGEALAARGWRSLDLVAESGFAPRIVSGWLNGREPSPDAVAKLRELGCEIPDRRKLVDRLEADLAEHPDDGPAARAARLGVTEGAARGTLAKLRARGVDVPEHPRGRPAAPTDREPVAPMVARILERTGWSQAQLARELAVTPAALSAWVRGGRYPGAKTLARLRAMADGVGE